MTTCPIKTFSQSSSACYAQHHPAQEPLASSRYLKASTEKLPGDVPCFDYYLLSTQTRDQLPRIASITIIIDEVKPECLFNKVDEGHHQVQGVCT
jgi:hypothetical protein